MLGITRAEDVSVGENAKAMQLELVIDRGGIARYGLSIADVQEAVAVEVGGRMRRPCTPQRPRPFPSSHVTQIRTISPSFAANDHVSLPIGSRFAAKSQSGMQQ